EVALPQDRAAEQMVKLVGMAGSPPLIEDTQRVLQMLVRTAKSNQLRAARSTATAEEENYSLDAPVGTGDELTSLYVSQAAFSAQQVRPANIQKSLLLALGIFIDDSQWLRKFPSTTKFITSVEDEQQRQERLNVVGKPTMREREDLAKHFF